MSPMLLEAFVEGELDEDKWNFPRYSRHVPRVETCNTLSFHDGTEGLCICFEVTCLEITARWCVRRGAEHQVLTQC